MPSSKEPRVAQGKFPRDLQTSTASTERGQDAKSKKLANQEGDANAQALTVGDEETAPLNLALPAQPARQQPLTFDKYWSEDDAQFESQQPGGAGSAIAGKAGTAFDVPSLAPAPNDGGVEAQSPLGKRPGANQGGPGQGQQSAGLATKGSQQRPHADQFANGGQDPGHGKKNRDVDAYRYADQKPAPSTTSATKLEPESKDDKSGGKQIGIPGNKQQPSQSGQGEQLDRNRDQRDYNVSKPEYEKSKPRDLRGDKLARNDGRWGWHEELDANGKERRERLQLNPNEAAGSRDPSEGGNRFRRIVENAYLDSLTNPLSTFSIDVDTASYANVRQFIMQQGVLPPPNAVRIEELINYFRYDYAGPKDGRPFASHIEVADCPWAPKHKLVRVAIKGRDVAPDKRPQANLVFLIDVSGSMDGPNRLPLVIRSLKLLTEQLRNTDRVAIVVYAGNSGLVLPSTAGESRETILAALDNLRAGGSTNGGAGIELAYRVAKENYIAGGINRVVLCTDGDFNVGITSDLSLERLIEEKAKEGTFLTVLGYGCGNFNDSMLETISGKGNGNYAYVDNIDEARKVLVEQLSGTLMTIAKDVKIQIEFNPSKVAGYRLLGYEDRILAAEDFNNDKKDAGEIGSGHTVTALYEIVPAGERMPVAQVDELKYQKPKKVVAHDEADELLTLKIRYKEPMADVSQLIEVPVSDEGKKFAAASSDFQFAAAVAGFGMVLRDSQYKGTLTYDAVLEIASQHKGEDLSGYRKELLELIRKAKQIAGK
ncbi:MAG: von Willebrand factor type A domain-containing protein [Planctomycetes bacterium]|nr:von Willebrand factor type A domain-containing protein [Planctomycetota bacterium]